ncbi:MAG: hypothetical protein ACXWUG_06280 [Polyangiales bacterium]
MSAFTRSRLVEVRRPLLELHRVLIAASLIDHERSHGRVEAAQDRLDLVIEHPAFAWLKPISQLIVQIDEALDEGEIALDPLLEETTRLLAPADRDDELGRRYVEVLQAHPDVVLAHAELRRAVEKGTMN